MFQRSTPLSRYSIITACIASLLAASTTTNAQTDTTWTRGAKPGDKTMLDALVTAAERAEEVTQLPINEALVEIAQQRKQAGKPASK